MKLTKPVMLGKNILGSGFDHDMDVYAGGRRLHLWRRDGNDLFARRFQEASPS